MFWHSIKSGWYCELLSTPFFFPLSSFLFHISFAFCAWRCLHLLVLASHPVTLWVFLLYASYPFLIILPVLCYDYHPSGSMLWLSSMHWAWWLSSVHQAQWFSLPCIKCDNFSSMHWAWWFLFHVLSVMTLFTGWVWWVLLYVLTVMILSSLWFGFSYMSWASIILPLLYYAYTPHAV